VKRTQAAQPKTGLERTWHEPLAPDLRDPDIVRVKALERAASPIWQRGTVVGQEPAMATSAPKPGDFFPPELLRPLGTAQQVIDQHVNRPRRPLRGLWSRWPCRQVQLAEFALGAF
jgi:hypothetical protein